MSAPGSVSPQEARRFAFDALLAMGSDDDIAGVVADHLVEAHLVGHDSHGLLRLPMYLEYRDNGQLDPGAHPTWHRQDGATGVLDGHKGFGQVVLDVGMRWAIGRAAEHGVAVFVARQASHTGRVGHFAEMATAAGMIAQINVGSAGPGVGLVVPHGGTGRFLGTNPWTIGVPAPEHPVIFDGATSVVSMGKVLLAEQREEQLPPGALVDSDGEPTTDPTRMRAGGGLTALGGELAGHKGTGFALLGAMLGGLSAIDDEDPLLIGPGRPDAEVGFIGGVFAVVVDPARFGPTDRYVQRVGTIVDALERTTPRSGGSALRAPGTRSAASRAQRTSGGIPMPPGTRDALEQLAESLRVPPLGAEEAH